MIFSDRFLVLQRLGQSAGSKLPCPVLTWVAAIIHTIAEDKEISGGDTSLTGLSMNAVYLEGPGEQETKDVGLQLRKSTSKLSLLVMHAQNPALDWSLF